MLAKIIIEQKAKIIDVKYNLAVSNEKKVDFDYILDTKMQVTHKGPTNLSYASII